MCSEHCGITPVSAFRVSTYFQRLNADYSQLTAESFPENGLGLACQTSLSCVCWLVEVTPFFQFWSVEELSWLCSLWWDQFLPLLQLHHRWTSLLPSLSHSFILTGILKPPTNKSHLNVYIPKEPYLRWISNQNLSVYFLTWQNHFRHHLEYQDPLYICKIRLMRMTLIKLCY